jgi:MATE family multidrug resistance protein
LDVSPLNSVTDRPAAISLTRPARVRLELKNLLGLALPIMIAQLATTAMGFVDAVMAGRVGPRDLAALWLALVVGLMATGMLFSAEPILHIMKVDPELIGPCMQYLHGIASGLPAVAFYHVLRCFSDGLGRTRPAMVLGLCGLALNIPLNYVFIYGHFGVPAMGGVGCGWATAIVMWVMALGMAGWERWAPAYQSSELFSRFDWPQWSVIKRLLGIGLPIGIPGHGRDRAGRPGAWPSGAA